MWYIHINRGTIDSNRKNGTDDHPIAVRRGRWGKSVYGSRVEINGPIVIRYDPNGILACGAKVVIETEQEPIIVE
jgi:hypothetical protein